MVGPGDWRMTQADLLRYVVDTFEELGINYMISGSQSVDLLR